jgi:hypothetical protein
VILAPGAPLARWEGPGAAPTVQVRTCEGGRCSAAGRCLSDPPTRTPKCDPVNYLDRSPGPAFSDEDNARFVDRNDAAGRPLNRDGFILGPVMGLDGTTWVNDRLAVVSYDDLMPRAMRRVAEEVSACLRHYAVRSENRGRTPWAAPTCRSQDADPIRRWSDSSGALFGRVPDTPFLATSRDSGSTMLATWSPGCSIADANGHTTGASAFTWWSAWKRHVFYSVAPANRPASGAPAACDTISCLVVANETGVAAPREHRYAVLVAGPPLLLDSWRQSRSASADLDARNWLEGANAELRRLNGNPEAPECAEDRSIFGGPGSTTAANRVAIGTTAYRNDVVVVSP